MPRLAGILLAGGIVLLVSWIAAPASPNVFESAADLRAIEQSASVVDDMNAEVQRLRDRLARPPQYPEPVRNPFRFGRAPEHRSDRSPSPEPEPVPTLPPRPPLPVLIAITTDGASDGLVRRGVLRVGEAIVIARTGAEVGQFVVRGVDAGGVDLVDRLTGDVHRLTLRELSSY